MRSLQKFCGLERLATQVPCNCFAIKQSFSSLQLGKAHSHKMHAYNQKTPSRVHTPKKTLPNTTTKLGERSKTKNPSAAAAAAARNSQICLCRTSQFSPQAETNKQSSFQTTPRRESGYENSKLNPQFSQTTTVTAIDRREANKQQLQQYSQGRNEGSRKEGSRDRAWATHIAGNWGKTNEEVQVLKNEC